MTVRPKLSRTSAAVIQRLRRKDPRQQEFNFEAQELYREDDEGNPYTVIVWRPVRGLSYPEYTLDDGTPEIRR
jgi:hypothetical protein